MALSQTIVGRVDIPPLQFGQPGQPEKIAQWTVDLTLGATTDYAINSGIDLTSTVILGTAAGAVPAGQIVSIVDAEVRASGGTIRPVTARLDTTNNRLRLYRTNSPAFINGVQRQNQTNVETTPLSANAFQLPANGLGVNGQSLRGRFWGHRAAVANAVTINLKIGATIAQPPVGGTTLATLTGTANAVATDWYMQLDMIRTASGNQQNLIVGYDGIANSATLTNVIPTIVFSATTIDLTAAQNLFPTVTGTNTNDVTIEGQIIEILGAPSASATPEVIPSIDLAAGDIIRLTMLAV